MVNEKCPAGHQQLSGRRLLWLVSGCVGCSLRHGGGLSADLGSGLNGLGGGNGERGKGEGAEGSEDTERGFSDLRVSVGSVVQWRHRLMGWCVSCVG